MRIRRTVPPAAAPLYFSDLWHGLVGFFSSYRSLRRLEGDLREYFGVKSVFPVSSGKAALTLILLGLKSLSSRREVIIPAYTCYSVPSAIMKAGLKVVLCDIDPQTFDFDPVMLEKTVTGETLCVIPSHLFGIPSAMDTINKICRERGAYVVEDAAQAMGGFYQGARLGTVGDVGFFSLGRGKNITSGSGGLIVTNSDSIATAITPYHKDLVSPSWGETWVEFTKVVIMAIFLHPSLYWMPAGLPFLKLGETLYHENFRMKRLSGMQCGLLRNWIKRLERANQDRAHIGARYVEQFLFQSGAHARISWLRFPILVQNQDVRSRIYEISRELGLGISLMYPTPINKVTEIQADFQGQFFPIASAVAARLLALPTHSLVSKEDQDAIIELVNRIAGPVSKGLSPGRETMFAREECFERAAT